jgi:hypothetical protein
MEEIATVAEARPAVLAMVLAAGGWRRAVCAARRNDQIAI